DDWCIYPMYDYAHCISDSIEGITHSVCTLEFEDHRPLYEWFLEQLDMYKPQQIEFARLNLTFTVMSKRKLGILVEKKLVSGWDDPRMPTIAGLRRRGYTPDSVKTFCEKIGVAKRESTVDYSLLEHCLREELNLRAKRVMCVLDPLKLVIDNYEDGKVEYIKALNNPEDEKAGTRELAFSKILYIERSDFEESPPPKYYRLSPGREVRLKHAYYVVCKYAVKNDVTGEVEEIHCEYDPLTKGGSSEDKRKVEGTIHWVSQSDCLETEVRLYDRLFEVEDPSEPMENGDFTLNIDKKSLVIKNNSRIESSVRNASPGEIFQFLRNGYFCVDKDSSGAKLVFNRSVSLKDSWTKILKKLDQK
ncbi:glutamine--tRNA ligase, partial [candidate division WOR-3 bacterium]|nr:glutamine--tRNA ligase [candidate division WOR-3 bacterium]